MSDAMDFSPLWGEWYIKELLGKGTYGAVYRAEKTEYDNTYIAAIKHITIPGENMSPQTLIDEGIVSDEKSVSLYYDTIRNEIIKEINFCYTLKGHTNIVSYEDHCIIPKQDGSGYEIFIRMEYLSALTQYVREHSFYEKDVIQVGIDICSALEILDRHHMIHRDIKPANIFVSDLGIYKLGDFGESKVLSGGSSGMTVRGTYNYMSPEISKGQNANITADIYSLGIVMYRLLNGNKGPFLPHNVKTISSEVQEAANIRRFKGEPIPAPAYCRNPYLVQIVLKACAFRPQDRYQSPKEMRKALEDLLEGKQPVNAPAQNPQGAPMNMPPMQPIPQAQNVPQQQTLPSLRVSPSNQAVSSGVNSVNPVYDLSGTGDNTSMSRPSLQQNNTQASAQPEKKGSKKPIIIAVLAILIVAVAVVLILVMTRKPSSKSSSTSKTSMAVTDVSRTDSSYKESSQTSTAFAEFSFADESSSDTSVSESSKESSWSVVTSDVQYFQNMDYKNWDSEDAVTDIQNRGWKVTIEEIYGSYPRYNKVVSSSSDTDKKTVKLVVNNGLEPFEVKNFEAGLSLEDEKIIMMEGDTITTHITFSSETVKRPFFSFATGATTDITGIFEKIEGDTVPLRITGNSPCEGNVRVYLCDADTGAKVIYRDFYIEVRDKSGAVG